MLGFFQFPLLCSSVFEPNLQGGKTKKKKEWKLTLNSNRSCCLLTNSHAPTHLSVFNLYWRTNKRIFCSTCIWQIFSHWICFPCKNSYISTTLKKVYNFLHNWSTRKLRSFSIVWTGWSDWSVLKWNARALRTGSGQNGPSHGSESLSVPAPVSQSAGTWRVVGGKNVRARFLNRPITSSFQQLADLNRQVEIDLRLHLPIQVWKTILDQRFPGNAPPIHPSSTFNLNPNLGFNITLREE